MNPTYFRDNGMNTYCAIERRVDGKKFKRFYKERKVEKKPRDMHKSQIMEGAYEIPGKEELIKSC